MSTTSAIASQKRRKRAGLCIRCGKRRHRRSRLFCGRCLVKRRLQQRKRNGSRPWKPNGIGRPPLDAAK